MDYQSLVNAITKCACVISQKNNSDGIPGELCIEAANELYLKFLVIVENKTEEEFNALIGKIKDLSETSETVKFAIGSCFVDSSFDIRKAMHDADVNMYADKSQFYRNHPELSRRKRD